MAQGASAPQSRLGGRARERTAAKNKVRDELIAELKHKQEARRLKMEVLGINRLDKKIEDTYGRVTEIENQIHATPAKGVNGIAVKLAVAVEQLERQGMEEDWVTELVTECRDGANRLASGVLAV